MKIFDLMKIIWSNPKISEDKLLAEIVALSPSQKHKLGVLHKIISHKTGNMEKLDNVLSNCEQLFSGTNDLTADDYNPHNLRDILVAFYLSEYRLDDYVYYPSDMKHKLFNDTIKQWHLEEDLVMPIYINWGSIKRSIASA